MPRPRRTVPGPMARTSGTPSEIEISDFNIDAPRASARWLNTRECPIVLADQLWIQASKGLFVLTFGHVELPYGTLSDEDRDRIAKEGLEVLATSRVVDNAEGLGPMIQALSALYERFGVDRNEGDTS